MKKNKLNFLLVTLFVLISFFLVSFVFGNVKVFAEDDETEIKIETTGYSILSSTSFIFSGAYAGNVDKKGFTTYFEFKKGDSDLDNSEDREETIKIVRESDIEEANDFYTSPELNLFSTYYFRAVGYFNDDSSTKYYGDILSLKTGPDYIRTIPFTTTYTSGSNSEEPEIVSTDTKLLASIYMTDITENSAVFKGVVYNKNPQNLKLKLEYGVKSNNDFDIQSGILSIDSSGNCILALTGLSSGTTYKYRLFNSEELFVLTSTHTFTTTGDSGGSGGSGGSGSSLVKCGVEKYAEGEIVNGVDMGGAAKDPCGFDDILTLINDVIDYLFKYLILPLAAIMFAYAGFELMTSGGSTEKRGKAKKILINVAIGLVACAAAFLIVRALLSITGARNDIGIDWFGFFE